MNDKLKFIGLGRLREEQAQAEVATEAEGDWALDWFGELELEAVQPMSLR